MQAKSKILDCLEFDCESAGITLLTGMEAYSTGKLWQNGEATDMHSFALCKSVSAAGKCLKPVQREQWLHHI